MTSLYLHLPFCTRWCAYCAFYSEEYGTWKELHTPYIERLRREIEESVKKYGPFDTIFLGGGNPFCLPSEEIASLLKAAGPSRETTVEMNPESLEERYEPLFAEGLVSRVSMGIQSMRPDFLSLLGRNSDRKTNERGIARLMNLKASYGIQVNFDLITCIPTETIADATDDIDQLLAVSDPDHLSVYSLTLEPKTALARRVRAGEMRMPDGHLQADMLFAVWNHLKEKGFVHYEVSNFARDGAFCQHNLRYWRLQPYLGLGSHAASRLQLPQGFTEVSNTQNLSAFAHGKVGSGYKERKLTGAEEMEEFLLTNLRTIWGIDKQRFEARFHQSFDGMFHSVIRALPLEWFHDNDQAFSLSEQGMMVLDEVILRLAMML